MTHGAHPRRKTGITLLESRADKSTKKQNLYSFNPVNSTSGNPCNIRYSTETKLLAHGFNAMSFKWQENENILNDGILHINDMYNYRQMKILVE